jgi:hypothetical protein
LKTFDEAAHHGIDDRRRHHHPDRARRLKLRDEIIE